MNIFRLFTFLVVVEGVLCCGCCTHKDLTKTDQVQRSGILGRRFCTAEQLELAKDEHSRTLLLVTRGFPLFKELKQIGVVEAGTGLQVNREVRVKELVAILVVLPEFYSWNCTLAKIENGPYAGKEVAVGGEGLVFPKFTATIGGPILVTSKPTGFTK